MRRAGAAGAVVGMAALAVCLAPGVASADVLFDPADAEELAATLDEAYQAQDVCYGWAVTIDNVGLTDDSVGSNFGAGRRVMEEPTGESCSASVEFTARITWTSETSELEDSGSYAVVTTGGDRPDTADLNSLELISVDGLIGDNGDVDVYKAVSALPLLAADAGLAEPLEATRAPATAAGADAQPTNSPGSDFWRNNGMMILWGSLILIAGVAFAVYVLRSSRGYSMPGRTIRRWSPDDSGGPVFAERRPVGPPPEHIPAYVPEDWSKPAYVPEEPAEPEKPAEPDTPAGDPDSPPEPAAEDDPAEPDRTDDDPPEASSPDEPPRPKS